MIAFLSKQKYAVSASVAFISLGFVLFFTRGFKFDVDFVGGSETVVSFQEPVDTGKVRSVVAELGAPDASVQAVEGGRSFIIQVATEDPQFGKKIFERLKEKISSGARLDSVDWVGAAVGRDIRKDAFIAVVAVLLATLAYISLSSRYRFAVGAVVAIAHDLLAVLTVFLITGEKISGNVLMALLTVLGYSLNDTIVIFNRVGENLKKFRGRGIPEEKIFDLSINQTMRRTLLTSISTFIAVATLFFLGGLALKGFSLAMMAGVVVGTYSSIFIAAPVALAIKKDDISGDNEQPQKVAKLTSSFSTE